MEKTEVISVRVVSVNYAAGTADFQLRVVLALFSICPLKLEKGVNELQQGGIEALQFCKKRSIIM